MLHERIADAFLERFVALASSIRIGNPLDANTEMGPLTSKQHLDRVLAFVDVAREQGGRVLTGGSAPQDPALANGYYVRPTVIEAKSATDRIAQEEVFGPFVTVLRFGSDDEALAIANATEYGLGSGLWTKDLSRAHKMASQINAGMCWINCYKRVNPGSRSAASASRATAARWASRRCTTTPRRGRCGSTSTATCRRTALRFAMDRFVYQGTPSRVVFEWGALDRLPDELSTLGARRALILSTPEQRPLAERVETILGERAAGICAQAVMHVPIEVAHAAREMAGGLEADCCVAIGGGSTIGLGKAIALESVLPILPTTYAGSEMTPIFATEGRLKRTGRDARVLPRTVLYDPSLTLSLRRTFPRHRASMRWRMPSRRCMRKTRTR